mgnify:CR=1 FL=1
MNIRFLDRVSGVGTARCWRLCGAGCASRISIRPPTSLRFVRSPISGITDRGHEVGASDKSPLRRRIEQLVEVQLVAKGVPQVNLEASPDLLVHLFFGVKGEQRGQKTGMTPGLLGRGYGWGPGFYAGHMAAYEYHERHVDACQE